MAAAAFDLEDYVRGYHVYQQVWSATEGETLSCTRERSNREDCFAVAVMKGGDIVGHIPRCLAFAPCSCSTAGL